MATKYTVGGNNKFGVNTKNKGFVKPTSTPVLTTKVNVGGVLIDAPVYGGEGPPPSRMMNPNAGGSESIPETAETFAAVETSSGFNWTYVLIGLVAVVVLFFVFKKK